MEGYETTRPMIQGFPEMKMSVLSTDSYQKKNLGPVEPLPKISQLPNSIKAALSMLSCFSPIWLRIMDLTSPSIPLSIPIYHLKKPLCNLVHLHLRLHYLSRGDLFKVMRLKKSLPSLIEVAFMPMPEEQELYNFRAARLTFRGTEQRRSLISTTNQGSSLPASSNTTNQGSLLPASCNTTNLGSLPARSNIHRRLIRKDNMVEWMFLGTSLGLETLSAIFDQLSSPTKPHYALSGMLIAIVAVLVCISELVYNARKERVVLRRSGMLGCIYYPTPRYALFRSLPEVFGLVAGTFQCIFSILQYNYLRRHHENPIKLSAVPLIFLLCLIGKRLIGNSRRRRERLDRIA